MNTYRITPVSVRRYETRASDHYAAIAEACERWLRLGLPGDHATIEQLTSSGWVVIDSFPLGGSPLPEVGDTVPVYVHDVPREGRVIAVSFEQALVSFVGNAGRERLRIARNARRLEDSLRNDYTNTTYPQLTMRWVMAIRKAARRAA